jgi:hypothetical protein
MESQINPHRPYQIKGQMLRLSEHHAVAIYLREGILWVADFAEDQGVLVDANTWFRFNCGNLANSHSLRRMALESAMPISSEFGFRIEALHAADISRRGRSLTELVALVVANAQRFRQSLGRLQDCVAAIIEDCLRRHDKHGGHS